jgi:hypothetical protein
MVYQKNQKNAGHHPGLGFDMPSWIDPILWIKPDQHGDALLFPVFEGFPWISSIYNDHLFCLSRKGFFLTVKNRQWIFTEVGSYYCHCFPASRGSLRAERRRFRKTWTNVLAVSDHGPRVGLSSDLTFSYRSGNMWIDCNDILELLAFVGQVDEHQQKKTLKQLKQEWLFKELSGRLATWLAAKALAKHVSLPKFQISV